MISDGPSISSCCEYTLVQNTFLCPHVTRTQKWKMPSSVVVNKQNKQNIIDILNRFLSY